jgi:hypothetical protein
MRCLAFALGAFCAAAQAETLTYVSPLTGTQTQYSDGTVSSSPFSGTLAGTALFDGAGDLTSLSFSLDGVAFDLWSGSLPCSAGCILAPGEFEPLGNDQWQLTYSDSPYPAPPLTLDAGPNGDDVNFEWGSDTLGGCANLAADGYAGAIAPCSIIASGTGGVWADPPSGDPAPELDPGEAASALLLLLGGVAVIAARPVRSCADNCAAAPHSLEGCSPQRP